MKNYFIIATALFALATSCNTTNKKNDNDEALKQLNEQSLQCIRIMNKCDAQKTYAMNAGDKETYAALQKTMDSAAKENVKIGQKMLALQKK